jgi:Cohesin domain
MTKRLLVLVIVVCAIKLSALRAQVGFSLPTYLNTTTGQELLFPVKVTNFDSITGIQLMLQWDPAVLRFEGIQHANNPLNLVDSLRFNLSDSLSGKIKFQWTLGGFGKTLADGDSIFTLKMKVTGANGTFTDVRYTEDTQSFPFFYFEVIRAISTVNSVSYGLNQTSLANGRVEVGTISTSEDLEWANQVIIAPNPASDAISVVFDAEPAEDAWIELWGQGGQLIFQRNIFGLEGRRGTVIAKADIPAAGAYFVRITTGTKTVVRPIIFR